MCYFHFDVRRRPAEIDFKNKTVGKIKITFVVRFVYSVEENKNITLYACQVVKIVRKACSYVAAFKCSSLMTLCVD